MQSKVLALLMTVLMLSPLMIAAEVKQTNRPQIILPGGDDVVDGTYKLGKNETELRKKAARLGSSAALNRRMSAFEKAVEVGDEITFEISDFYQEISYPETFKVVQIGTNGIILVTKAAYDSFDGIAYHFANPNGDGGEGFMRTEDILTTEQLTYMLNEFDNNIYKNDTEVFGEPNPRGAEGKKTWILLHNIQDDSYYVNTVKTYIAGYFSAGEDIENNKNMMHIDTYDWINRIGKTAKNPLLYEGVFAHEFQHLIHFDRDPDEDAWVDEGLADLAGFICGYGHPSRHIAYYLAEHPVTSLTFWGGELADYGATYLFSLYLYEKFGGKAFISNLINQQANGIEGIENSLSAFGYPEKFNDVFDDWTIANYLDDDQICHGKYGYQSLVIGSTDTLEYTIKIALEKIWSKPVESAPFSIASDWAELNPQPYTAHYHLYNNTRPALLKFTGDPYAGILPKTGSYEWYSGAISWAWRSLSQDFDIPVTGATLQFDTYYEIENNWDYAYVEVYDHTTGEWSTLKADGLTTDDLPIGQDNPNVPEEREPTSYKSRNSWNAFTGNSDGWKTVSMDLSAFSGHQITLSFVTWQDGAVSLQMMYVDNITIPEIGFFDGSENEIHGWATKDWTRTDGKIYNNFSVVNLSTFTIPDLSKIELPIENKEILINNQKVSIFPETQTGLAHIIPAPALLKLLQIAIISNQADHILTSKYNLELKMQTPGKK